ncbi:outer membrane protein assembly factor BamB family protein [Planctomicrobium sp. SH527]|uniref:outer membrane protein assembly factor BamB family protein n=1 Tax=Planctomicrobium sp. SH527 TaxID=3448123 RepID=UPI003F5AE919
MPFLNIFHLDGQNERRELSKQFPVTIGRHSSNDIIIDDPTVDVMHCRISWGKTGFEAVSAMQSPLDVNGVEVQRSQLKHGDLLRFGTVDLYFIDNETPESKPADAIKQVSIESSAGNASTGPKPARSKRSRSQPEDVIEVVEIVEEIPAAVSPIATSTPSGTAAGAASNTTGGTAKASPSENDRLSPRLREALNSQRVRPGEEDIVRSPLVLGLGGLAFTLFIAGIIFYSIGNRQTTQQAFDAAKQLYDEGNYRGSLEAFDRFLERHPKSNLTNDAKRWLGASRIRQHIEGSATQYSEGLKALQDFIAQQRDRTGFETLHADIWQYARTIALGAANAAGVRVDRGLLEISAQARQLVTTYTPKDVPAAESLIQIDTAARKAESIILKDGIYRDLTTQIDAALTEKNAISALQLRRQLLVRYPELKDDKRLASQLQKMLETEVQHVVSVDSPTSPETTDHPWPIEVVSFVFQSRQRLDEVPANRTIPVVVQNCCYGVELVTGQPLWRRVIGPNTPFFPLNSPAGNHTLLFDSNHQELVCLHPQSGQLQWRLPLKARPTARPLLSNNSLFITTADRLLRVVDLDSGEVTQCLQFSQPLSGLVQLESSDSLLVSGLEETLYLLSLNPLKCTEVFDLGHSQGSIQAPLIAMASYFLVIENGSTQSTLHLLQNSSTPPTGNTTHIKEIAQKTVQGRVIDPPVLRGQDLFVPSSGERVSTFTISDDAGQPPLTPGPILAGKNEIASPIFLRAGPDRQLWMATGALQRLQLTATVLQANSDAVSQGIATQPLLFVGNQLFHTRRRPFAAAAIVTRTEQNELTSDWQTVLGGKLLALNLNNSNFIGVNDNGIIFRTSLQAELKERFNTQAVSRLPLPNTLATPLLATTLSPQRIAVTCGGSEPKLWLINSSGQIEATHSLPSAPQTSPALLGKHVLIPLQGKIIAIPLPGANAVQEFLLPQTSDSKWVTVLPLSEDFAAAILSSGQLFQLSINSNGQPTLSSSQQIQLNNEVQLPLAAGNKLIAVARQDKTLSLFSAEHLAAVGERTFNDAITGPPVIALSLVLVEENQRQLHALKPENGLPTQWSIPLNQTSVAGVTALDNELIIALQDGHVLFVQSKDGTVTRQIDTGNRLTGSPLLIDGSPIVVTDDGTLIRVK